jgi:hypothetical protein
MAIYRMTQLVPEPSLGEKVQISERLSPVCLPNICPVQSTSSGIAPRLRYCDPRPGSAA